MHKKLKKSGFSAILVLLVVAAFLLINLATTRVSSGMAADLSETNLYRISEDSRDYLKSLQKDINIRLIGSEIDDRIAVFARKYAALSDHLTLDIIDPLQDPSVLDKYGIEDGCAVFEAPEEGRIRTVSFSTIIGYDLMRYAYYGEYVETYFDADSCFTNAVNAVDEGITHTICFTDGHGEADLANAFSIEFLKKRYSAVRVNLLKDGGLPDDCDCVVIHDPDRDLSADELSLLLDYLQNGGKILLFIGSGHSSEFLNLKLLAAEAGITITDDITSDELSYYQNKYLIFPQLSTGHETTRYLTNFDCLLNKALALSFSEGADDYKKSFLLSSSEKAVLNSPNDTETKASFVPLAAVAENVQSGGILAVLPASLLAQTTLENYGNLCNLDICMNLFAYGFTDAPQFVIPAIPLGLKYNAVPHTAAYGGIAIAVIPAALLIFGSILVYKRKRV